MQKRQTTTKSDIRESLAILLKDKTIEEISVSQITKKAGINRSTFYLHYLDKADLLAQLKQDTFDDVAQILHQYMTNPKQALIEVLTYLDQGRSFLSMVAKGDGFDIAGSMTMFISQLINRTPGARQKITAVYSVPEKYAISLFTSGVIGVIIDWLKDPAPEKPEELAHILLSTPGFSWFSEV